MSVTMQDIADRAGIHLCTVSRALSGDPRVRQSTRERILALAVELGYTVNRNARNLATGRTRLICLAAPAVGWGSVSEAADAVSRCLAEHGYTLMILVHNNEDIQFRHCLENFAQSICDGAILYAPPRRFASFPEFDLLRNRNFPMICLDQWLPERSLPAVTNDAVRSIALLTDRLLGEGMDGALLHFPAQNTVARARFLAACRQLKQKKIPYAVRPEELPGLFRRHRIRRLAIYGDSPKNTPDPRTLDLPRMPERCLGGMFDHWLYQPPEFYDRIFLCIQDFAAEGRFAAASLLRGVERGKMFRGVRKFPPLKIISPA